MTTWPSDVAPTRHRREGYPARTAAPSADADVHHVLLGDPRHGITRLAASLLPDGHGGMHLPALRDRSDLLRARAALRSARTPSAIHLHVNDDLLGPDAGEALAVFAEGRRLALTLHDIPQPAEGAARFARRAARYRAFAEQASLVIVCSEHERRGLRSIGVRGPVAVVDHPIDARAATVRPARDRTVGVLGWIHPGKGHADVLDAMAEALPGGTLVALGAASAGHERLPDELAARAARLGLGVRATGYLDDAQLLEHASHVAVPVVAHRHISASGSLGTWMTAGRAPVVVDSPYARDVLARCPGALSLTRHLATAIAGASEDPDATALHSARGIGPSTTEAAARQADLLQRWATA